MLHSQWRMLYGQLLTLGVHAVDLLDALAKPHTPEITRAQQGYHRADLVNMGRPRKKDLGAQGGRSVWRTN